MKKTYSFKIVLSKLFLLINIIMIQVKNKLDSFHANTNQIFIQTESSYLNFKE